MLALAVPLAEEVRGFGRDEIRFRLAGRRLGEQRLAGSRRPVQQEALGGADTEAAKGFRVLQGQLDTLAQQVARLVETADVVPADGRGFDHDFAHRRRLDALQRILEVMVLDRESVEDLGRDGRLGKVELGHDPPHRFEGGLAGQRGDVGADEAKGAPCKIVEVHVRCERHSARVDAEDLASAGLVGNPDHDLAVEAAGPAKRFVERLGAVGRCDDHRVLPRLDTVEQGQQLGDEPLLGFTGDLAALRRDRVDLVDEDDRGRGLRRLLEQLAQPPLALAISRAHDLGSGDVEELGRAFVGDGARQQRLAGSGRTMEQDALGRVDSEALEELWVAKGKLDHFAQRVDRVAHSAEVIIGNVGPSHTVAVTVTDGIFGQ